jgi:hypothetical protein
MEIVLTVIFTHLSHLSWLSWYPMVI